MSKKILFLLLVFMLTLTGCNTLPSPSEYADLGNTYYEETDYPIRFNGGSGLHAITPTEDGYFFFVHRVLHFFDKESLESTVFCNRPECLHGDETCSAYFRRETENFLQYYNGKLYVMEYENEDIVQNVAYIYEVDPVECTRQKLCQLPYSTESSVFYMMHRGYLYMAAHTFDVEAGTGDLRLERVALNRIKEESLSPETVYEGRCDAVSQNPFLYGEHCFLGIWYTENGEAKFSLLDINLKTQEEKEVIFPDAEPGANCFIQLATDESFILTYIPPETVLGRSLTTQYYTYNTETGEFALLNSLDGTQEMFDHLHWDGKQWIVTRYDLLNENEDRIADQGIGILNDQFETEKEMSIAFPVQGFAAGDEEFSFIGDNFNTYQLYAIDKRGDELKLIEIYKADSAN